MKAEAPPTWSGDLGLLDEVVVRNVPDDLLCDLSRVGFHSFCLQHLKQQKSDVDTKINQFTRNKIPGDSRLGDASGQSDLGHGHGAVALVVSKLGLLVGSQGQRRVLQFGERRPDGQAEDLLEPLVDVEHGVTTASPLVLQRLKTRVKTANEGTSTGRV